LIEQAQLDDPSVPVLTELEREIFSTIIDTRRDLLRQISTLSNTRINSVSELQSAQQSLLGKTESLQTLLDENLIWVRSVPAIGPAFPRKVLSGTLSLFSPQNFGLALTELVSAAQAYVLVVIGFLLSIFLIFRSRSAVRADVKRRAALGDGFIFPRCHK